MPSDITRSGAQGVLNSQIPTGWASTFLYPSTFKDHVPHVTTLVAVVCNMQGLVHVAHEMNYEFEGLTLSVFVGVRVFQCREELFRLGDYTITARTLTVHVDPGICHRDVDVMPWGDFAVAVPVLIGPHGGIFGTLGCE